MRFKVDLLAESLIGTFDVTFHHPEAWDAVDLDLLGSIFVDGGAIAASIPVGWRDGNHFAQHVVSELEATR